MNYITECVKDFKPTRFETHHTMNLRGQEIKYMAVAEENVFYDKTGTPLATIYSYSYIREDVDSVNRPVLFCYNGGPGTSSMYVHAGLLGPKRIVYNEVDRPTSLPPYEMKENPDCLLDIADIVCVDPVNAGYGLLIDEKSGKEFFGIDQDAEALLNFIQSWLQKYNRMLSPKYLVGESYGCTRNAVAAGLGVSGTRNRSLSLAFDGIVNIGNTITPGKYFGMEIPAEDSVLRFTSYAAIHWYHNHPTEQSMEEFIYEAKDWAESEYILALFKGESLSEEKREEVLGKLMYYTGLKREYLVEHALKIEEESYWREVLKDKGLAVSRLDARVTRPLYEPYTVEQKTFDDAMGSRYDAYFLAAVNGGIMPELGVKLDRTYASYFNTWDKEAPDYKWDEEEHRGRTGEHLNKAMHKNFGMRVFFANGWFDTATYTGYIDYLLNHQGLPKDRICRRDYPSGHMIYLGEENCRMLADAIRAFLTGGMPHN